MNDYKNEFILNSNLYNDDFYNENASIKHVHGQVFFVDLINDLLHPKSVIDIGCGVGGALSLFKNKYHCEVQGIDGDYVNRDLLLINTDEFTPFNIEEKISANTQILKKDKFDLAISTEVAEHLLPSRAESFVEDLTRLSDCVLFSAAVPMQGGTNHINERPIEYWVSLFDKYNYTPISCIRPIFKKCITHDELKEKGCNDFWYANNIVLYIKTSSLQRYNINPKKYEDDWQNIPVMQLHIFNSALGLKLTEFKNKSKIRYVLGSIVKKILL